METQCSRRQPIRSKERRNDVEVNVANTVSDVDRYQVGFYNNDCLYPATASDMDGLVSGLKEFINVIPGAAISEEK